MTDQQQKNLAIAARYIELYNSDVERFVRECYHPDYTAFGMGAGSFQGLDTFIEVEKLVLGAAPKRRMRLVTMHATETAVIVEVVLEDPDQGAGWELPFCAVLEIRDDKILVDRTYADFKNWPGLSL